MYGGHVDSADDQQGEDAEESRDEQHDPPALIVAVGQAVTQEDEAVAEFFKLAGLSIITNELRNDSSPAAQEAIGAGLARDLSRKLDAAFFGKTTTNGPSGLGSLAKISVVGRRSRDHQHRPLHRGAGDR